MTTSGPDPDRSVLARAGLPNGFSRLAAGLVALFVLGSAWSIETSGAALIGAKDEVVRYFDWLFVLAANVCMLLVVALAIHPRANVRLGEPDARPEFSNLAWFAMLFSAGLASGLLYWAAAEPILHARDSPLLQQAGVAAGSPAATTIALRITVMHWGLHGWAFYVVAALAIAVYSYKHGRPLTFRSALIGALGPHWVERAPGRAIDLVALLGDPALEEGQLSMQGLVRRTSQRKA